MELDGVAFQWLGHDGFRIRAADKILYIDPYQLSKAHHGKNDADIVLISHNHFDHLSVEDLKHLVGKKTTIVAAKECVDQLKGLGAAEVKGVVPGEKLTISDVAIEAIAAYNTNKKFHPKSDGKVGFVVTAGSLRIYHTGDTDDISEMKSTRPDVALVPVSGTYVMTAEEAAKAVNEKIKPKKLAIPMHYGAIVGIEHDANRFKQLVRVCAVELLKRE